MATAKKERKPAKRPKRAKRLSATAHVRQLDLATATGIANARAKLGKNIRARRLELGLTQTDVALACDVGQTSVGVAEGGKYSPKLAQLLMVARALKTTASDLLHGVRL